MNRLFAIVVLAGATVHAQTPPIAFAVASIRPTPPNAPVMTMGNLLPDGRWSPRSVTVAMLISSAFPEYALRGMTVGGPGWINERRFDIDAATERPVTPAQRPQLIRRLLMDRFGLKMHTEARLVDVYSLVRARSDGRPGPRLRPASAQCSAELEAARELDRAFRAGLIAPGGPEPKRCNARISAPNGMMLVSGGRSMSELADTLRQWTGLKVMDRTGLEGDYELELEFDHRANVSLEATPNLDRPSLSTAVQEQLGLKLERQREMLDVLVIDAVEPPSEN